MQGKSPAESYGIEMPKAQQLRGYEAPTATANAPAFIKDMALVDLAIH